MGIGGAMRSGITSAINDIGSTVVITPYTQSSSDKGFSGQVPTDGTPVNEVAIPFDELLRLIKQPMGNLESGTFQIAIKFNTTISLTGTTKYKVTYQGDDYDLTKINNFLIEDTVVARILTLSKRFT